MKRSTLASSAAALFCLGFAAPSCAREKMPVTLIGKLRVDERRCTTCRCDVLLFRA
jgi:hypothetical protein